MRISDWSSDVCSSDLPAAVAFARHDLDRLRSAVGTHDVDRLAAAAPDLHRAFAAAVAAEPLGPEHAGDAATGFGGCGRGRGAQQRRSADRRVGQGGVSTWRYRWERSYKKYKIN